jgi:serine O-acetyltransferase
MTPTNAFLNRLYNNQPELRTLPSKTKAHHFADQMIALLFPIRTETTPSLPQLELSLYHLKLELQEYLYPLSDRLKAPPQSIVEDFFDRIPEIYDELLDDAQTIERFDPAAASVEEVIVAYPGFYAIAIHRLAHLLVTLGVPTLPRMISEYAHAQTGIDIHPGAKIGKSFFIDHGTGIVIGETTVIGNNVKIYQGVTLGALSVRKDHANTKRHPTIEDSVIIYSGSTILGGETVVGHDSIIGGNVWLTESVLPYSIVYHKSEVHVRNEQYLNVAQDFMI